MNSTVGGRLTYETKLDTSGYQKGINDITSKTKSGGATVKNIVAGLGITKLVTKAFDVIRSSMDGAISRLDTMNNFPKVMSNLGISAKDSTQAINRLSDGLQGIPTTLDAGALAVQRFTSKNGDVQKSVDIFLAVNDAILAGGASTQIQESALEQLSQAYAKGKMDMVEWRTLQTAMPAQLKQVATAMGLTTEELGEMMRKGDSTAEVMDNFVNTIIKMDKTGVKGFKSLKEQSRNATGGIQTNITNMKTAIVRGVATMIDEFDKLLKNKGLGGLGALITKVGKTAEKVLKDSVKWMAPVVDITLKLINVLTKFSPVILGVVTAITTYKVAMGLATTATNLFTTAMSLNPIGLAVAGFAALAAAMVTYTNNASSADRKTKELNDKLKEYDNTSKEIDKRRQETLNTSMQEIYNYQSLYEELKNITDANGKVKDGYEDRAKVITGQLSEALGIEMQVTDGVIKNYQELQEEIDKTIEYKKALSYFNAHEEEYNNAVKKQTEYQNTYNKALKNSEDVQGKYNEKLKWYAKHLRVSAEELDKVVKGQLDVKDSSKEMQKAYNNNALWDDALLGLSDYEKKLDDANNTLKKAGKTYAENQEKIYNYNTAQQYLADGNYDAMYKIYNDTITFNAKTTEANDKKYTKSKEDWESYRQYLTDNQKKFSEDFIKSENERIDKELQNLENEKNEANKKLEEKNKKIKDTTITGINDQLKALTDHRYEFKEAADGNMELYVDSVKQKGSASFNAMQDIVNKTVGIINSKNGDAKQAGEYLTQGVAQGIDNGKSWVLQKVNLFTYDIMARLKTGLGEHSPSRTARQYGKWLDEGLQIGIEDEKNNVINTVDNLGDDVINKMRDAVNIQTGKMAFSGTSGSVNQILTATGTTTVINENKLLLDGDVVYENQKKVSARKNLQTQFGGAYNVSN